MLMKMEALVAHNSFDKPGLAITCYNILELVSWDDVGGMHR